MWLDYVSSSSSIMMNTVSIIGLAVFLLLVVVIAMSHGKILFFSTHGWSHRVAGAFLLTWLVYGIVQIILQQQQKYNDDNILYQQELAQRWLFYDTILGFLGITTTLTAARDFPHKYVQNAKGQSGSLSQKALVTQREMVEHSFYQALNLLQAWYLHYLSTTSTTASGFWHPWLALWLVTSPWLVRGYFPVHSFSHNWNVTPEHQRTPQETVLYRIKKGQYLFYKHVLLHGLNISMALQQVLNSPSQSTATSSTTIMTTTLSWRIYWLALNTSYVMEFFLQTMVRRRVLSVAGMFGLQQLLMATSSIAAIMILFFASVEEGGTTIVRPAICFVSLVLNLIHRHHDVLNVLVTAGIFYGMQQYSPY